jgi:hypothetical protein
MNMDRRHRPQVIRANELARAAGLDPRSDWQLNSYERDEQRRRFQGFMDEAFDEHFARVAEDNIYWNLHTADRWDIPSRDGDCHCWYGRCKSGSRWFWYVRAWVRGQSTMFDGAFETHGLAASEAEALAAGIAAIKGYAAGRRIIGRFQHGTASYHLKKINKAKREAQWSAQPSAATDSKITEYLFAEHRWYDEMDCRNRRGIYAFPITKKTAKRIYYKRGHYDWLPEIENIDPTSYWNENRSNDAVGFVDREELEAKGEVYNHGRHWSDYDFHLRAKPPVRHEPEPEPPDLAALKAEMAAARPDRGGSNAAFIEARKRYVEARSRLRASAAA